MYGQRTGRTIISAPNIESPQTQAMLHRLARELRMVDQILGDDVDTLEVVESMPFPAMTSPDGTTITFALNHMPKPYRKRDIAVWLGTNAHELGHSLFSPRGDSTLMRRLHQAEHSHMRGIHQAWNILEDQRMERLVLGRFEAWRAYLSAALVKHIAMDNDASWLFVSGRTWLPAQGRAMARALFVSVHGEQAAVEATQLIDAYQYLADSGEADADVAFALIVAFRSLLTRASVNPPPSGCSGKVIESGSSGEDGDEAQERAQGVPTAAEADEDDDTDDDDGEPGDGEPGDDDAESDDDEDPLVATNGGDADDDEGDDDDADDGGSGDAADDDGDEADDGDDDGSGEGDEPDDGEPGGDGAGRGDPSKQGDPRSVADAMRDGVDEQLADDDVAAELDQMQDTIEHGKGGHGPDGPEAVGTYVHRSDAAGMLEHDVTDALMDLRDEAEPGWTKRVNSGRFNTRRWATDPHWSPDDVFDRYEPGQLDSCSFEVVLILDVSGSMNSALRAVGEATWAIRRAVDALEGKCTTLTFSDGWAVLPGNEQRPDDRVFIPAPVGGTNPVGVMREAARLIAESDAAQKLVVMLTDGDFYREDEVTASVGMIHESDGLFVLAGMRGTTVTPGKCNSDHAVNIARPDQLATMFRDVAVQMMRRQLVG